ncbi:MAG TPA: GIY-YIG nuclease family protein [Terriglobales bacterium]
MKLLHFLKMCRQDLWDKRVKMVRHVDERWDLDLLLRTGHFDEYQTRQGSDVFNCDYIVSFIGETDARSRFLDVFAVHGSSSDGKDTPYSPGFIFPAMGRPKYRYDLSRVDGFEVLRDRLVIDWGTATRSWHQWLSEKSDKDVIELRPRGFVREFSGFDDVHLRFDELKQILDHPDANRLWHTMLRGVAGVYLIVDDTSGDQYVGSAYGEHGILGRWKSYATTKHGGNKRLKALLADHPQRYTAFWFSILRTLSRSLTAKEVITIEEHYKRKLGTRAFGLNENG